MKIDRQDKLDKISKWYYNTSHNTVLFITGIKDVGKTTLVNEWLKTFNDEYVFYGENEYKDIKDVFEELKEHDFNIKLKIINKMMKGRTSVKLMIIDGIEPGDEIIVQIRKLIKIPETRFILLSDYGDYVFEGLRFLPAGSVERMKLMPLSFKEYCETRIANDKVIESIKMQFLNNQKDPIYYSDKFELLWNDYSRYGGFPSVVSKLLNNGVVEADNELIRIKKNIVDFYTNSITYSKTTFPRLFELYSKSRSSKYSRFVYNALVESDRSINFERAISILTKVGLFVKLPIVDKEWVNTGYYDLFLCDPGLEYAWNENVDRKHVMGSVLANKAVRSKIDPSRMIFEKDHIIDMIWKNSFPRLFQFRERITFGLDNAVDNIDYYRNEISNNDTYSSYILVDKYKTNTDLLTQTYVMPMWLYLLVN